MRTIKFRGNRVDNGGWVYGDLLTNNPTPQILAFYGQYLVDKDTIGQFTGLLDKNGKEIFEGDIVRDSEGRISYVKWLIQRCGFVLVYERFDKDITGSYGKIEHLEVIGNIHDNPELIKEK